MREATQLVKRRGKVCMFCQALKSELQPNHRLPLLAHSLPLVDISGNGRNLRLRPTYGLSGPLGSCPSPPLPQSPASEGEEEELLMEEDEEEVLAGVSTEDKSRRPPAKGPLEPPHPGEGLRGGEGVARETGTTQVSEVAADGSGLSSAWLTSQPCCLISFPCCLISTTPYRTSLLRRLIPLAPSLVF